MDEPSLSDAKRRVIAYLKRSAPTGTNAVAEALGVTDVAARQHLRSLAEQGFVEEQAGAASGRGRPPTLWRLKPLADGLFPDRHDDLTVELIAGIRGVLGEDALDRVIDARTARQREQLKTIVKPEAPLAERAQQLAAQRTREGYIAEVVAEDDGSLLLIEHHCPICDAAKACQGFCRGELDLFQDALGEDAEVLREEHLLSGGARCVYRITPR